MYCFSVDQRQSAKNSSSSVNLLIFVIDIDGISFELVELFC